eukprot:scaffold339890_cov56-Prasinocladus_malaysianus.AAC.1
MAGRLEECADSVPAPFTADVGRTGLHEAQHLPRDNLSQVFCHLQVHRFKLICKRRLQKDSEKKDAHICQPCFHLTYELWRIQSQCKIQTAGNTYARNLNISESRGSFNIQMEGTM